MSAVLEPPAMLAELAQVLGDADFVAHPLEMLRAWAEACAGAVALDARYHVVEGNGDGGGNGAALTELESLALALAAYHGQVRNRDLRARAPDLSAETVRLCLVGLCARGLLVRRGRNRGSYYTVEGSLDVGAPL